MLFPNTDPAQADAQLYATQGGGYATYDPQLREYVWHSDIPKWLEDASAGDPIPDQWSVAGPINL